MKDQKLVKVIGVDPTSQSYMVMDDHGKSYTVKPADISHKLNIPREKSPDEIQNILKKQQDELSLSSAPYDPAPNNSQEIEQPPREGQDIPDTDRAHQ